ncbi:hypothetical protein ACWCSD_31315 [Nonomuraea sp. NPDC001684]
MTMPQFQAPNQENKLGPSNETPTDRWDPIVLETGTDSTITVTNFSADFPELSTAGDRSALVRAGQSNPDCNLSEDAWHAIARAVIHPEVAAHQIKPLASGRGSMLHDEHVGAATLKSTTTQVWLTELWPLVQPRIGQDAHEQIDPEIEGHTDTTGKAVAVLVYRFRHRKHLAAYLRQTIVATRRANQQYDESILARRITRQVVTHVARLEFEDGTEPIYVLVVRDGITRVVSAWGVLAGTNSSPEQIADLAVETLLSERPTRRGADPKPLGQRMALGRQDKLTELRDTFAAGVGGGKPTAQAIRIGQASIVPAQVMVGMQVHPGSNLPRSEVFDDAVRSILASIHVEFGPWDSAAQNAEVGSRALKRTALTAQGIDTGGISLDKVYQLAIGRIDSKHTAEIFDDPRLPDTPLWRAICLIHFLTRKPVFEKMKGYVKEITGKQRLHTTAYAQILGPIVDQPWRAIKVQALKPARNAWSNGGVLTSEVLGTDWSPVPVEDFNDLVDLAAKGDIDARMTLAVAGGVALIADKLLTRNTGSAEGTTAPFRADVNDVIADLSRKSNVAGLRLLAHVANHFDGSLPAKNSYTAKQFTKGELEQGDFYLIPRLDSAAPDGIARDEAGAPEELVEYTVVAISDPVKAEKAEKDRRGQEEDEPLSENDRLALQRSLLLRALGDAEQALNEILQLARATGNEALGTHDEWQKMSRRASKLHSNIDVHEPPDADSEANGTT